MLRTKNVTFVVMESSNDLWKAFGKWLQAEREKTGITQDDVAGETGLNVKSVSRIERGEGGTKRKTIIAIIEAVNNLSHGYQLNLNEALRRAGFTTGQPTDDELVAEGLFEGYYDLPEEVRPLARKQIAAIIRSLKDEETTTHN